MPDIYIDPTTNDVVIENGRLKMVDGVDEVRQRIDFRLNLLYGEWLLNTDVYVDWFNTVIGKLTPGKLLAVDSHYQEIILGAKGVRRIVSYTSSVNADRTYSAEAIIEIDSGVTLRATIAPVDFGEETFGAPEGSAASLLQNVNVMIMGGC